MSVLIWHTLSVTLNCFCTIGTWTSPAGAATRLICGSILRSSRACLTLFAHISHDFTFLHCALSLAAKCIVIGPVCGFVCLCVCVFVGLLP